jgi:hypothetical protein
MKTTHMVIFGLLAISLLAGHVFAHDTSEDYTDYEDCTDGSFEVEDGLR